MRKVISMIHLFSELAATGNSDITNSYAENHISTFLFIQSVPQSLSLSSFQNTEEGMIQHNLSVSYFDFLMYYVFELQ